MAKIVQNVFQWIDVGRGGSGDGDSGKRVRGRSIIMSGVGLPYFKKVCLHTL